MSIIELKVRLRFNLNHRYQSEIMVLENKSSNQNYKGNEKWKNRIQSGFFTNILSSKDNFV